MSYEQVIKKSPTYHKPGILIVFKVFYYISSLIFEENLF